MSPLFPIPEVVRGINAFMLGARSVNPDAEIRVIWVNSWYDPGKEREAADTLLSQGADVVTHHTDSPAAVQAAQETGKMAIGYHSDMFGFWQGRATGGGHSSVGRLLYAAGAGSDGRQMDLAFRLARNWRRHGGHCRLAFVAAGRPDRESQIHEGENFRRFISSLHRPIKDNEGNAVAAAGEALSDDDLLGMNYYVEGVQGKVPQ